MNDAGSSLGAVCVVVTTYNHAHFLDDALESVARQTRPAAQVVVVDDGSTDDPAAIVSRWPSAQLIRQDNQGLSSARNTGLRATRTPFVVFLDADDLLEPGALDAGWRCANGHGDVAFVYGAHRSAGADGRPKGDPIYQPLDDDVVATFLRGNPVGMHATVLYRSSILREAGGFDERLTTCEDYDMYLRLAHSQRVATHSEAVARYRWHGLNMSRNRLLMLRSALQVQRRYRPARDESVVRRRAYRQGRRMWRDCYAEVAVLEARHAGRSRLSSIGVGIHYHPSGALVRSWLLQGIQVCARRISQLLRPAART